MTPQCDVVTCKQSGTHIIGEAAYLCLRHAIKWDKEHDARVGRLHELQLDRPEASDDEAWAENYSRWCGEQK